MPLYIDSREWPGGTYIFTGTTTNATALVDGRYRGRKVVFFIRRHHHDSTCRAVTGAVATLHTVGDGHAVLLDPYRMTYLNTGFHVTVDGFDGTCGTYIGAMRALWTTISAFVAHHGLHKVHQVC